MWRKLAIICSFAALVFFNIWLHDSVVVPSVAPAQQSLPPVKTDPPFCGPVVLDRKLPVIALASYPRSGNSFTRHLLEESSGYTTGSVYNDIRLWNSGLHGENQLLFTLVVKTHGSNSSLHLLVDRDPVEVFNATKVLLLVRFPFDSIWSHFNLFETFSHTKTLDNFTGEITEKFDRFVNQKAPEWRKFYKYWLDEKLPTKIVRYEDLKEDLCGEVAKILDFLLPDQSPHSPAACLAEKNKSGEFKSGDRLSCAVRRNSKCSAEKECRVGGTLGKSLNRYTENQIKQMCNFAGDYIKLFGYPIPAQCGTLSESEKLSTEILNTPPLFKQLNFVEN